MSEKSNLTLGDIEKFAIYSEKKERGLGSIFARKEEFKKHLLKVELQWNIAEFPKDVLTLLRSFIDTGTIYILVDKKLRASLYSYVTSIIHILEEERDRETFLENIKKLEKTLEATLIPYFTEFSKNYEAGATVFHIIIKSMLSSILRDETKGKSKGFIKKIENEITRLTNSVLDLVRIKSRLSLKENVTTFIGEILMKIPILTQPVEKIGSEELENILLSKGFSISLFTKLYKILFTELRQTIEKNLLQILFSYEIYDVKNLLESIDIPISRIAAEEVTKNLKQLVSKKLSILEERRLEMKQEIEKNFEGFNETSKILWEAINSEITSLRDGKNDNTLDEVTDRSSVLSSLINKKMWSIKELINRKKRLDAKISSLRKLETISPAHLVKHSSKMETVLKIEGLANFYFALIKHFGKGINKLPPKILVEAEKILKSSEKEESKEIIAPFCERHFLGKRYYPERLLLRFLKCFEDVIIPIFIENTLTKFISIWPPIVINEESKDLAFLEKEANYVGDFLIPENKFLKIGKFPITVNKEESRTDDVVSKVVSNFSKFVTVLIYDIRGSTFMGTKLANAKRESAIRKKFSERMLKAAEKYGAFPIKDTGDGGILLFSGNSRELFGKIYAPGRIGNEWLRTRYKKEDLKLKEGEECAKMAVLTAKEMMLEAQKFVSENIREYSDWFKEEKERKLFFKGISYAQLPPSYKKIFQIGIGIASGHIERDIFFSINAYGDPDITGNLVRDANLYSKARNPESSVILMDSSSLLNLLLSEEIVEPIIKEKKVDSFSETETFSLLLDKTLNFISARKKQATYRLKKYGLIIERIGLRILEEGKQERIIPALTISELGLKISDAGELRDRKGGIVKFLYEVSLEE